MIPRVQTGSSFKGAGLYYLHDKREKGSTEPLLTDDRVAWTHALNTVEDEPEQVLAEMRQTSFDQPLLKLLSGNRIDGRPTEKPVMTIALSWAPTQAPSQGQMIEAAKSYLDHMGWSEHQALLVAHNDTKHPHLHIILNRVHPGTGMGIDDSWRNYRSHQWGLVYERETGRVLCEARIGKYERGEAIHAPHNLQRREWETWQEIRRDERLDPEFQQQLKSGEWDQLRQNQKIERLAFWEESKQLRKELGRVIRDQVRAEFKEEWAAYAVERAERTREAKEYDREARRALQNLARAYSPHLTPGGSRQAHTQRGPDTQGMKEIKRQQKEYHARLREEMRERRATIDARQKERTEDVSRLAFRQLSADRRKEYDDTLAAQRAERSELKQDQAAGTRRQDLLTPTVPAGITPATPAANQNRQAPTAELGARADTARTQAARIQAATPAQAAHEITGQPIERPAVTVAKTAARENPPREKTARDPRPDFRREDPARVADAEKTADVARGRAAVDHRAPPKQPEQTEQRTKESDLTRRRAAVDQWMTERKATEKQRERQAGREITDQRASTKQPEQTERRTKESELARRRAAVDEMLGERKADRDRGGGRGGRDR